MFGWRFWLAAVVGIVIGCAQHAVAKMPEHSPASSALSMTEREEALRDALRSDVEHLSDTIGERNLFQYQNLLAAADFLQASLESAGYVVQKQDYEVAGKTCQNLEVEIRGSDRVQELVIIGAHYDSVIGSPGANDNATGVAAVLALARAHASRQPLRSLRFVWFVNEEPPFFQTQDMGSVVYAKRCHARHEHVVAMLSLETIGYYVDARGSQHYPFPFGLFYPSKGNFIGFVSNVGSRRLLRQAAASFRRHAGYPSEAAAVPGSVIGVGWSDHWSFWREGYPGVMVTDTAPFRYPYYHTAQDTSDKINYARMAQVVTGLEQVVADLVGLSDQAGVPTRVGRHR